ncbi:hypothetical protein NX779_02300 [Mycoplasma cottewii]|uniref:Uncharacterized protein n=1 Tax=Mycoplasma cottewii TaxID=51364 RepID=A0ABY5TVF8_9MOLU|nr:hypothetical protein [Mycoplasma cottewii]UWD34627.1 hypothetical protein NX779_02300 [Mycoplasma cottewii]
MRKISRYLWILIALIVAVFASEIYLNKPDNEPRLTNVNDYHTKYNRKYGLMWAGHALRYYLYRNSSAFDKDNIAYEDFIKSIEKETLHSTSLVQHQDFKYSLISSVMVTSEYGSTSAQEFFAESFSKYVSSNENQKNLTWYLLDHFFSKTFIELKDNFSGGILVKDKWDKIKKIIDLDSKEVHEDIKYDINLEPKKQNLTPADLGYNIRTQNTTYIYGFFNVNYMIDTITNLGRQIFSPNFRFNINSINRIGTTKFDNFRKKLMSSTLYNPYKNRQKTIKNDHNRFKNIDELDQYWLKTSKFKTNNGEEKSSIQIKKNLDELYKYSLNEIRIKFKKEDLYNEALKLFNTIYKITGDDFKKIFINLILTNDKQIQGIGDSSGVNGITSTQSLTDETTTIFSFVIIRNESFEKEMNQHQFNLSWFSSNNRFQTLHHEFGHVLDAYLSKQKRLKGFSSVDYKQTQQAELYEGSTPVKDVYALVEKNKTTALRRMCACKCCC